MKRLTLALALIVNFIPMGSAHAVNSPYFQLTTSSIQEIVGTPATSYSIYSFGGAIDTFTVSPSLSSGLTIDPSNGHISGTPTAPLSRTTYTLTAHNSAGFYSDTFALTVFASVSGNSPSGYWQAITSDNTGNKIVAAMQNGGIYYSPDSGNTWALSNAPNQRWYSVSSSSDGTKLVAAAIYAGVYTSLDSGHTWTLTSLSGGNAFALTAMSGDGHVMVAATTNSWSSNLWVSLDYGSTWTQTSIRQWFTSVAVSGDGSRIVASSLSGVYTDGSNFGTQGAIFASADHGQSWSQTSAPIGQWSAITINSDGTKIAAAVNPGFIYTSANSGLSWVQAPLQSAAWTSLAMSTTGQNILGSVLNGGLYASLDSGSNWTQTSAPTELWQGVATSGDGSSVLLAAASIGTILRTTWQSVLPASLYAAPPVPDPLQQSTITAIAPTTGVANAPTNITASGNFIEKISAIQINGVGIATGSWVQTPTSITFTIPVKVAGKYSIQIYNGSAPVLAEQTLTISAAPTPASLQKSPKQKVTYIRCAKPGHGTKITYGVNPVCPSGYVKK